MGRSNAKSEWCDSRKLALDDLEPIVIAAYVEYLLTVYSNPTVKQHLAAIRMCLDWLVSHFRIASISKTQNRGEAVLERFQVEAVVLDCLGHLEFS